MRNKTLLKINLLLFILLAVFSGMGFTFIQNDSVKNLVQTSTWYIAGPAVENQETLNRIRQENSLIKITAKDNPVGEIELNVLITASDSNDGAPTNLSNASTFLSITYKSSHVIKLQAREGNTEGTGCIHGGSHARITILPSPKKFTTIKIAWSDFKQDELPNGKLLNIHNLCKLNFVNYNPVSGAFLEIKSVLIQK